MTLGYIHTLGDSTLDNFFWVLNSPDIQAAKQNSVEGQLQERVKTRRLVVNSLAFDGFTTKSVLQGDRIGDVLPLDRRKTVYMREKASRKTIVHPLEDLRQTVSANPRVPHYVVLSVGGNDFRENLLTPWRLLSEIPEIQNRYLKIVDDLKNLKGRDIRPILMLQYQTDAKNDPYLIYTIFQAIGILAIAVQTVCFAGLTAPIWVVAGKISLLVGSSIFLGSALLLYVSQKAIPFSVLKDAFEGKKISRAVFAALLHKFYQPILERAKKDRIPILDLPNTFNPNENLYVSGIEPGIQGGALIAEGIDHVIRHHSFSDESFLYSKPDPNSSYLRRANRDPSTWEVTYRA